MITEAIDLPKIQSDTKVTKEFTEDADLLLTFIQDRVLEFRNYLLKLNEAEQPIVFFFTYFGDDYDMNMVNFRCINKEVKYIYLTIPEKKVKEVLKEFRSLNRHLVFKGDVLFGHNADDVIYNRITIRLEVIYS